MRVFGGFDGVSQDVLGFSRLFPGYVFSFGWQSSSRETYVVDLSRVSKLQPQSNCWGRTIVNERVGVNGKAQACTHHGCFALIDNSEDILKDALQEGLEIYPIKTHKQSHRWWTSQGGRAYTDLWEAVIALMAKHEE